MAGPLPPLNGIGLVLSISGSLSLSLCPLHACWGRFALSALCQRTRLAVMSSKSLRALLYHPGSIFRSFKLFNAEYITCYRSSGEFFLVRALDYGNSCRPRYGSLVERHKWFDTFDKGLCHHCLLEGQPSFPHLCDIVIN